MLESQDDAFGETRRLGDGCQTKKGGHYRLYLCTKDPKELHFDLSLSDAKAALFAHADAELLPLTVYVLR